MVRIFLYLMLAVIAVCVIAAADDKTAMAPLPIDIAFTGDDEKSITDAILANPRFKMAVSEALKSKKQATENKAAGRPTPEQAARARFLEVLNGK